MITDLLQEFKGVFPEELWYLYNFWKRVQTFLKRVNFPTGSQAPT